MKIGLAKSDITPRVGVELCGFGPFLNRHSTGIRDRLWARAMAVEHAGTTLIIISCDLAGIPQTMTRTIRETIRAKTGLCDDAIMVCCTHTHSGPGLGLYIGWGEADPPYVATLPQRIAAAALDAVARMQPAALKYAETPCLGVAINREYDTEGYTDEEALRDDWRPSRPELTDTTCHVITACAQERLIGFISCFSCHPVVCCAETTMIHGDYCGVATNAIEQEHPDCVGLFLQGSNGDINTCFVHRPQEISLRALDIIANRYARSVRKGIEDARPLPVDFIKAVRKSVNFSRRNLSADAIRVKLSEEQAFIYQPGATDTLEIGNHTVRMAMVHAIAYEKVLKRMEQGESIATPVELHGMRIGPVSLLASPFEAFHAVKLDVIAQAPSTVTLVVALANDSVGYAPDRTAAARGGYATDTVPLMCGQLPFTCIHDELCKELVALDKCLSK